MCRNKNVINLLIWQESGLNLPKCQTMPIFLINCRNTTTWYSPEIIPACQWCLLSCSSVSEVLSEPVLEIVTVGDLIPANMMRLNCHHQYNAPAPKPPVHYYFFRNNLKLGMATSENHDLVKRTPGQYTCKIRVPVLGLVRWSQPKSFGQVTGTGK